MSRSGSRFMRSMTPSGSVKMTPTKFNVVCGRTREMATTPDLSRIPNPQPPRVIDAKVTTPTMSRKEFGSYRKRDASVGRESRAVPAPPSRSTSLNLPFGSYADLGCHTRPPQKYSNNNTCNIYRVGDRSRRSNTPSLSYRPQSSYAVSAVSPGIKSGNQERRFSATFTQQSFQISSRQRHSSCSIGTPAAAKGISYY